MFPSYIPQQNENAPRVSINKNVKYLLVEHFIPPSVHITVDIMTNRKKLTFIDHNLRKFLKFHPSKYMTSTQWVEGGPIELVPMYWACEFDKYVIILLLYMSHFGRTTEVNTCVK